MSGFEERVGPEPEGGALNERPGAGLSDVCSFVPPMVRGRPSGLCPGIAISGTGLSDVDC